MSYTILIIDDEEHARNNISEYLKTSGYEVFEAGSLKEGRQHINNGDGDVIILDVQLPDGYGLDFLTEIATLPQKPPVILITGYGDIEMAVDAMKNGAHDFLTKPIMDLENLETSISRATEIVQMRRELNHFRQNQSKMNDFVVGRTKEFKVLLEQAGKSGQCIRIGSGDAVKPARVKRCWRALSTNPALDRINLLLPSTALQFSLLCWNRSCLVMKKALSTDANTRKHGLMEVADGRHFVPG